MKLGTNPARVGLGRVGPIVIVRLAHFNYSCNCPQKLSLAMGVNKILLQTNLFLACWVFDRVERGIPVGSVPNLFEIGECSIACKNHGSCDYFVWYPRTVVSSYFYNDCMLGKRVGGEMVTEVGKITGYPGLAPGDCPTMTGTWLLWAECD